jgi:hypothetical protein
VVDALDAATRWWARRGVDDAVVVKLEVVGVVAKPPLSPIQSYAVYMLPVLHPLSWLSHAISCFTLMSSTPTRPPLITAHRLATESAVTNAQHDAQISCWLCTGVTTAL